MPNATILPTCSKVIRHCDTERIISRVRRSSRLGFNYCIIFNYYFPIVYLSLSLVKTFDYATTYTYYFMQLNLLTLLSYAHLNNIACLLLHFPQATVRFVYYLFLKHGTFLSAPNSRFSLSILMRCQSLRFSVFTLRVLYNCMI